MLIVITLITIIITIVKIITSNLSANTTTIINNIIASHLSVHRGTSYISEPVGVDHRVRKRGQGLKREQVLQNIG